MKIKILISFSFLFVVVSCRTHETVCDKAKRKYPACFLEKTIIVRDTIVRSLFNTDTIFITKEQDTLYIDKEQIKIKIIRNYDTIKTDVLIPADTIYIIKEIPAIIPINIERKTFWKEICITLGTCFLLAIILFFTIKKQKS